MKRDRRLFTWKTALGSPTRRTTGIDRFTWNNSDPRIVEMTRDRFAVSRGTALPGGREDAQLPSTV
jgi:hypothetical protein